MPSSNTEPSQEIVERLIDQPLAVTTLARDDELYGSRLQAALIRGEDELFRWGIGAKLERGAIVALYIPNNHALRVEERNRIRHLYSVATSTVSMPEFIRWKQVVFLYRRLTLACPLNQDEMENDPDLGGYARRRFRDAGFRWIPRRRRAVEAFWRLVLTKNPELVDRIMSRLLSGSTDTPWDDVAISYASEDMGFAQRLNDGFIAQDRTTFYSTSAWALDPIDLPIITELLSVAFKNARVCVPLVSRHYIGKLWPLVEFAAMLDRPNRVLAVSLDKTQPGHIDLGQVDFGCTHSDAAEFLKDRLARASEVELVEYERLEKAEDVITRVLAKL